MGLSKKSKKRKKKQEVARSRRRRQASRRKQTSRHKQRPKASSPGSVAKVGDLYHVYTQSGLNSLLVSGRPTLVDFWAPWCQPCLRMAPTFERMAASYGDRINFAKIDTQSSPQLGKSHGVRSIPTLIAFLGRKEAKREVGLMTEQKMRRLVEGLLPEEEAEEEVEEQEEEVRAGQEEEHEEQEQKPDRPPKKQSSGFAKYIKRIFGGKKD